MNFPPAFLEQIDTNAQASCKERTAFILKYISKSYTIPNKFTRKTNATVLTRHDFCMRTCLELNKVNDSCRQIKYFHKLLGMCIVTVNCFQFRTYFSINVFNLKNKRAFKKSELNKKMHNPVFKK